MSAQPLRRADARFCLPHDTRRAGLLGHAPGWGAALSLLDCPVLPLDAAGLDVVVTSPARVAEAVAADTSAVLVEGPLRRTPPGWRAATWTLLLRRDEPLALVPAGRPALLRHALRVWTPSDRPRTLARAAWLRLGRPVLLPQVTVLTRQPGGTRARQVAAELGAAGEHDALVLTGGGSHRRRVTTLLFPPGAAAPALVVKASRTPGGEERPLREQEATRAVAATGVTGVRVPRVLGVVLRPGTPAASLEEAAPGTSLAGLLALDPAVGRSALLRLTDWLLALAVATRADRAPGEAWPGEQHVRAAWDGAPALAEALASAAGAPGVRTHGDLTDGGNVLVDGGTLSVVDWETSQPCGLPLLDLLPVLAHGLAVLRVGTQPSAVAQEVLACALGTSPDAALLRDRVSTWRHALRLTREQTGAIAALSWAAHGAQPWVHRRDLADAGLPVEHWQSVQEQVGRTWLAHPGLGSRWAALG